MRTRLDPTAALSRGSSPRFLLPPPARHKPERILPRPHRCRPPPAGEGLPPGSTPQRSIPSTPVRLAASSSASDRRHAILSAAEHRGGDLEVGGSVQHPEKSNGPAQSRVDRPSSLAWPPSVSSPPPAPAVGGSANLHPCEQRCLAGEKAGNEPKLLAMT
ncbi:hypothetical protein GUJ93_ZPchr0006g45854 [Zizania palustris]|uniref:Uncharacterized protein n=1 Tax=Zizania palustris TaxID=103762 RepID=A0A8J5SYE1_ZIZPA|nr:hypothetical protein GUJ93_ZPchr0006g45854 [Zizania palustris]